MSVKVHEAFSIDSFQDRLLWWDDFLGDQMQDEWNEAGTGSVVVVDAQTGGIVRITSGATSGQFQYIDWADIRSLHVNKRVSIEFRVKLTQTDAEQIVMSLRFDASNRIKFRYDTGIDVNWLIETVNGGAATLLNSGIAADTDYHIFRIECFPTDEVHFYIDGVETANSPITTNIPDDAADYLQPRVIILTNENAAKSVDVDYCVVRQEI